MPATSRKQQAFMGAELRRKRAGKATQTDMSEGQLEEYAHTPRRNLPKHARPVKRKRR